MSGVFGIFSGIDDSTRSSLSKGSNLETMKSRTTSSSHLSGTPGKIFDQSTMPKPKGLSMRPKSALNIHTASPKRNLQKDTSFLKPTMTQTDVSGTRISPRKEKTKVRVFKLSKVKASSPNLESSEITNKPLKKLSDPGVFKKPKTPIRSLKKQDHSKYPEPEVLAPYYDEEKAFNDIHMIKLDYDFKHMLKKQNQFSQMVELKLSPTPTRITQCMKIPVYHDSKEGNSYEDFDTTLPELPKIEDVF